MAVYANSVAGPTLEEQKAQDIAHNKAAAAEAIMRKEKRKQAQEKKREQKRQRAELQSKVKAFFWQCSLAECFQQALTFLAVGLHFSPVLLADTVIW